MVSNACASWSGQEVGLKPQRMPFSLWMASFASMPSTSLEMPCKLPLHPPVKDTERIMPLSKSMSIDVEQTPFGWYFIKNPPFPLTCKLRVKHKYYTRTHMILPVVSCNLSKFANALHPLEY